ncbi:MAG: enoyl-CoA hydratase/isomerase family protein [Terriglobia bacterium]
MQTAPECAVLVEQKGPVTWVTLNRPHKHNALNTEMSAALARACKALTRDVEIVVLRGSGKNFCAGSDVMDLYAVDSRAAAAVIQLEMDAGYAFAALPQLTIAVLHGKCCGGGAMLPLYCDMRIGYAGVELALPETRLGWAPPYGIERLVADTSAAFALDMLLTGRVCGDKEALASGWLQRLVNGEAEVSGLIEQLLQTPGQTRKDTLALARARRLPAAQKADGLAFEAFLNHFDTEYARQSIAAFVKRKQGK